MGLINRRTKVKIGGLRVVIKPMSTKLGPFFKRYGCLVTIHARKRRRRKNGTRVLIKNHYFINVHDGTPVPGAVVISHTKTKEVENQRRTALSEYLVFGAKKGFPDFPIKGVISQVRITIDGHQRDFEFTAGSIDPSYHTGAF